MPRNDFQSMIEGGTNTGTSGFLPGSPNQYDPAYGGIPGVPNPTSTGSSAITGNLSNLQNLFNLATGVGGASGAGTMSSLNQQIPGVSGSIGASRGNIDQLLSGQVPEDVIGQMRQQSAEIGAGAGMGPMSPFSNANYLRALGLTSLGMKEKGMSALNSLMGSVPRAPAFDPSSMLVSPGQQQEWEYLAQVMANAPQPRAAANANLSALRSGAGFGGSSPVGGFNLPVHGGPAFAPVDTGGGGGYGPTQVYGPTGSPGQYPAENPSPQAYQNWQNLAAQWGVPGMAQEDVYNQGLTPAIEDTSGYGGSDYYDPYSMDSMYGE